MVLKAISRRQDAAGEAVLLVAREPWAAGRPVLLEGRSVTVLSAPQRNHGTGATDLWVTVTLKPGHHARLDRLVLTLTDEAGGRYGRLDPRGQCVVQDVPDVRHRLALCRTTDVNRPIDPRLLPLDPDHLGYSARWTSADGSVTIDRLHRSWSRVHVRYDPARAGGHVLVGRVVGGHLELRALRAEQDHEDGPVSATLEFVLPGRASAICLPLPG